MYNILENVHKVQLKLALEVKRICQKNSIENPGVKLLGKTLEEIQKQQAIYSAFRAVKDLRYFCIQMV